MLCSRLHAGFTISPIRSPIDIFGGVFVPLRAVGLTPIIIPLTYSLAPSYSIFLIFASPTVPFPFITVGVTRGVFMALRTMGFILVRGSD